MSEPSTWTTYRSAWRRRPWLLLLAIIAVVLIVLSLVATVAHGPLALLFIPGLAVAYLHHELVRRSAIR